LNKGRSSFRCSSVVEVYKSRLRAQTLPIDLYSVMAGSGRHVLPTRGLQELYFDSYSHSITTDNDDQILTIIKNLLTII